MQRYGYGCFTRFMSFDEQPIVAPSIAQVHHAVMKDHQEVVVKVQYPGLEDQMKFDLATMSFLSNSVAWNEVARAIELRDIVTFLDPMNIKLGQALSIRPNILSLVAMTEL